MTPHGYIVTDEAGAVVLRGTGNPGAALDAVDPSFITWFATEREMLEDPRVAGEDHKKSLRQLGREDSAERSPLAYAAKLVEARTWLATNPIDGTGALVHDVYPYLAMEVEIATEDGPSSPWIAARAIIAAHERDALAAETARRWAKRRLRALRLQSGS